MFKMALVAIDGSQHSLRGVKVAREMFEKGMINSLILISVIPDQYPVMPGIEGTAVDTLISDLQEALLNYAQKSIDKSLLALGESVKARSLVEVGNPAERIIATAKQDQCDLIIIGSRGLNPSDQVLMGSVSTRVFDYAPCAVMVIK